MAFEAKFDTKKFEEALEKTPGRLFVGMRLSFTKIGNDYIRTLTKERLSGAGDKSLARRTGTLARSFAKTVAGSELNELNLMIFTDVKYAPIHQFGGTIRPKKGKYLAIPLGAAKTRAGVARWTSPRDVPDLKYGGRSAAGNILLRTVDGTPMFVLVRQVTIKPRLGMFETWDKEFPGYVEVLNTKVGEVLRRI